jgi:Arc/MetJ-type ribon-helix-helix transcriptional regulator
MSRISVELTPELEQALSEYMKLRHIGEEAEAIRAAVAEAAEQARQHQAQAPDFSAWIGLGLRAPLNPNPRFRSDDDLWR